jgi:hypothetical protein
MKKRESRQKRFKLKNPENNNNNNNTSRDTSIYLASDGVCAKVNVLRIAVNCRAENLERENRECAIHKQEIK